jgi:hypothetical protein
MFHRMIGMSPSAWRREQQLGVARRVDGQRLELIYLGGACD